MIRCNFCKNDVSNEHREWCPVLLLKRIEKLEGEKVEKEPDVVRKYVQHSCHAMPKHFNVLGKRDDGGKYIHFKVVDHGGEYTDSSYYLNRLKYCPFCGINLSHMFGGDAF